ncbi:FAD binding domain-containing protein [Nocardioides bigeumensis]|uniref:FAD-binding PCMH-type domain-containing protein n=1 Tax=Nocardioides bigeumensis TaxID=433657 RepID=A0ABN2XMF9_9ACTN
MPVVDVGSVQEAVGALSADRDGRRLIGGGTGLMLMARSGFFVPETLVSLRRADDTELLDIRLTGDVLRIGALCTLRDLELDPAVRRHLPTLAGVLRRISSVRTRNVATIAGCLAHGDPKMDLPTYLMALGAELVVASTAGRRRIALRDFFVGYYETVLDSTDVIVAVEVPTVQPGQFTEYRKFTGTLVEDWPLVSLCLNVDEVDGAIDRAAVTVGALGSKIKRLPQLEEWLLGQERPEITTERNLEELREVAHSEVEAKDDNLASGDYKRKVFQVELVRAVRKWAVTPPRAGFR